MLTCVIKRSAEPDIVQLTQKSIMNELWQIPGSEMLLEDSWTEGLRKVRTPYVCLVEPECVLSSGYIASNFGILKKLSTGVGPYKGGGYTKLAMLASCLGVKTFDNRIYNYELKSVRDGQDLRYYQIRPERNKRSSQPYDVQVAFVPGAIIRYASIKDDIDSLPWDVKNLIEMSTAVCFNLWNTGRRIKVNPNTTYVSGELYLEDPPKFKHNLPDHAGSLFAREGL